MEWISVNDELPKEHNRYLVTDGEDILVAGYDFTYKGFYKIPTDDRAAHEWEPTHWMPLPNPPKE